jgi:hypothetical protein
MFFLYSIHSQKWFESLLLAPATILVIPLKAGLKPG